MKRSWLEVERREIGRTERYCLDGFERVVIGRHRDCELCMAGHSHGRKHAALTRLNGRWQVADLGSPGGTYMNERRMPTARWLDSGDMFWMNSADRFHFLEHRVDPRWEEHMARLAASDDSDAAWMVFSDALQELGDERGRKMAGAGDDPLGPLGFLERLRADDTVRLGCRFGFVQTLSVKSGGLADALEERVLDAVLAQPLVCLVRQLELDVGSFPRVALPRFAAAIGRAAPPSLRRVKLVGLGGPPPAGLLPQNLHVEWT